MENFAINRFNAGGGQINPLQFPSMNIKEDIPSSFKNELKEATEQAEVTELAANRKKPSESGWPKPYTPSSYRTKNLQDLKSLRRIKRVPKPKKRTFPKKELNNPYYTPNRPILTHQMRMYAQDQLMANPGGDEYFMRDGKMVYDKTYDHSDTNKRIEKDWTDAKANFKNALSNLVDGAEFNYLTTDEQVLTGKKRGLLSTLGKFAKNFIDAVTFGSQSDKPPVGGGEKMAHFGKKLFIDGLLDNILLGVPQSILNTGESLFLGILNTMEIVPDATIGETELGRKITTKVFDSAQVAVSYITDVLPTGEAWLRVQAAGSKDDGFKCPILYNLKTPTSGIKDLRWSQVRNTPFRKAIETVGTILSNMWTHTYGFPFISREPKAE